MNIQDIDQILIITADRNSISAADDMYGHKNEFEFDSKTSLREIIEIIEKHKEYSNYGGAAWAGNNSNYKCIRNNKGQWLVNQTESASKFFEKIDTYIRFERNSNKC